MRGRNSLALVLALPLALTSCDWFTDFKQQPKIDPWESPADTIPPRANPQWSVPITGNAAPDFMYSRLVTFQAHDAMAGIQNPVASDAASVSRGRILYQINCAVCHGGSGAGLLSTPMGRYGMISPALAGPAAASSGYSDGKIYGIIRNGRGAMPSYARLEDAERWDVVNYVRALQGATAAGAVDTSHGRPGETGSLLPGATATAPTRPAPHYRPVPGGRAGTAPPAGSVPPGGTPPPTADPHAGHMMPPPTSPPDTTKGA